MEDGDGRILLIIVGVTAFFIFIGVVLFSMFTLMYANVNPEYVTMQGEITSSEVITEHGQVKYFLLSFNNQEPVKVNGYGNLDFTVHSKLVVELSRLTFWFYASDVYSVVSITKLPDNK